MGHEFNKFCDDFCECCYAPCKLFGLILFLPCCIYSCCEERIHFQKEKQRFKAKFGNAPCVTASEVILKVQIPEVEQEAEPGYNKVKVSDVEPIAFCGNDK